MVDGSDVSTVTLINKPKILHINMAVSQRKSRQSPSGAKYKHQRKKKLYDLGGRPTLTKLGDLKKKNDRILAGKSKTRILTSNIANVTDPSTKKSFKTKILNVVGNPANRYFVRRNIITKGSIIETEKGKARVTSRPGQEGTINAVLVKQ
jgi:small subunit ribosomal protein S8e